MGLVPSMTPATTESILSQGMAQQQTPHPGSLDANLGLEPLDSLHHLPAMENMGYDQVRNCILITLNYILILPLKMCHYSLPVPLTYQAFS